MNITDYLEKTPSHKNSEKVNLTLNQACRPLFKSSIASKPGSDEDLTVVDETNGYSAAEYNVGLDGDYDETNEDLNDEQMQEITQMLTQTEIALEDQGEFDHEINLSQDDVYQQEDMVNAEEASLEKSAIDDDYTDIQRNPYWVAKRQKLEACPDTENAYFLPDRMFKKHDTYRHKTNPNFIYKIEELFHCGGKKMGRCTIYRKRSDTLLGPMQVDALKEVDYVKYIRPIEIQLSKLGQWTMESAPSTNVYYDDNNRTQGSHGLDILYVIDKNDKIMLTDEQRDRIQRNRAEAMKRRLQRKERCSQEVESKFKRDEHHFALVKNELVKRPTCFEAFAGCGGMTLGLERAGFHVKWAVENNHAAVATHKINHPHTTIFDEDILVFLRKLKAGIEGRQPLYMSIKPDHVHGSTPCQGFSTANRNGGKNDLKNNNCTIHFIRLVRILNPKTVSFENVTGMLHGKNKMYLQMLVAHLINMGYDTRVQILDASRCGGDAQKRNRVFVTAWKGNLTNPIPKPEDTHSYRERMNQGKLLVRTAADAIGDLADIEPENGTGYIYKEKVDGTILETHNHCLGDHAVENAEESLTADKPAPTIRRQRAVKHYSKNRCITVREMARLQSFPDHFKFFGSKTEQRNQVGNAVPIGLATEVARTIINNCYEV
jgi:DNA (cytosine-5)-methyltransferase 1